MASLKLIMDVNDDRTESHHINKKDVASNHPANTGHPYGPPPHTQLPPLPPLPLTTLPPITLPRYDSSSGLPIQSRDISLAVATSQTKHQSTSWAFKDVNLAASSTPPAVHNRSTMRRPSTASNDSADHTGYVSASSSMGGNYHQSNTPMRPMPSQPHTPELPMRLTPITGRVSRAKKGIPVHVCDIYLYKGRAFEAPSTWAWTPRVPLPISQLRQGVPSAGFAGSTSAKTVVSKKAIKCFKRCQQTTDVTIAVHPLHQLDWYHQGRAKYHLVGYYQALQILAEKHHPVMLYQEWSQSQVIPELKIHFTIPPEFNTIRMHRPRTSVGRLNHLERFHYSQEWKYPLQTYLVQNTGVILLRQRPPQAIQQLQFLKDALLDSSYGMPGVPFPLEDISIFDAVRADPSYSNDGVGYENGNLITLGLPISNGCGFPGATLPMSLMNPLHDAVAQYLEVCCGMLWPRWRLSSSITNRIVSRAVRCTILLGGSAVIRPSSLFKDLYKRPQLQVSEQTYLQGAFNPQVLYHHPTTLNYTASPSDQHLPVYTSWNNWVDAEARRRLLAACFFLDGHAAIYQQQPQAGQSSADSELTPPPVPLMGSSSRLWEASSAASWAKILHEDPLAGIPVFVPSPETITPEFVSRQMGIDRMIILVTESLRFPYRQGLTASSASARKSSTSEVDPQLHYMDSQFSPLQQESLCFLPDFLQSPHSRNRESLEMETRLSSLFPGCPIANTYLALHHTPLHDLLAVSGDSWLFTKKVFPAANFASHLRGLKAWAEHHHHRSSGNVSTPADAADLNVVKATMYAARSIMQFLSSVSLGVSRYAPVEGTGTGDRSSLWGKDISDYWALYVCALIVWAFGHKARSVPATGSTITTATDVQQQQQQQHPAKRRRTSNDRASSTSRRGSSVAADQHAITWLRKVAADDITKEEVMRARSRCESMSVVSLVRRRLESDCIGSKNKLYVEAIGVLRRLEEDGEKNDKPWF
ncbi:hypothetical protein B0T09DRAFT_400354 [Sordaria sp. MPI-SDFR-AT-0083]|nr:hypothetical protein B0T09DRAFT_400354 [Sordaria sp. MPI-SDFR-AT-0083]